MIVITGAAGFIGSCLVQYLNEQGIDQLVLVDEFDSTDKSPNLSGKSFLEKVDRDKFQEWLAGNGQDLEVIFHIGARTDTTEQSEAIFDRLNLHYTQMIWEHCSRFSIPLIYASSAATYGGGELGYDDDHAVVEQLEPLNPYGRSKNDFDKWALQQEEQPPFWAGLKFFNVYGPNEYHKGRMASVIFHTLRQIRASGQMRLFRSHRPDYADGQQSRDFVYVKDVVKVCYWLYRNQPVSGLYNLGTGQARSFRDLATLTFRAMDLEPDITFIDTPADIRDTYQYFTEANMAKLRKAGYTDEFYSLESGIDDYVRNYLSEDRIW
jgi:ADP-L-glycero-D-manno-heptose 6-epimerase